MATKWVYKFSEGNAEMRNLLGGKGANLADSFMPEGGSERRLQQRKAVRVYYT